MLLSLLSLAGVLCVLLFLNVLKRRYLSPLSDIPGPFLASFSILWQLWHIVKGDTHHETIALHKKHGYFVRISHKEVSVSHPEAIKKLLLAPLVKGTWYSIFSLPDHRYVNQMSELDPTRHMQKAKCIMPGYSLSSVMRSEKYVDIAIELMEERFDQLIDSGKPIEFDHWFNYFAFDVLGEVMFSKQFGFLDQGKDIGGAIANTRMLALYISVMGHMVWLHGYLLGNPLIEKLGLQPSQHIFDTTMATIEARKNNPDLRKDMLEQWTEAYQKNPERMEEKDILAAALGNVGAGADTVSATLQSVFYYLIRSPAHFARLRKELDDAQERGEISKVVSYAEAQKLPFLQACIRETYRYMTAVGFGLPRIAPAEGITIADRFFPAGTTLSVNPWVIHRNPALFGDDADVFNPERWLNPENARSYEKYLVHWGQGYNRCPGQYLAHFEISKAVATLARDYDVQQVDPNAEWHAECHFTIVPYDWPCKLQRRRKVVE